MMHENIENALEEVADQVRVECGPYVNRTKAVEFTTKIAKALTADCKAHPSDSERIAQNVQKHQLNLDGGKAGLILSSAGEFEVYPNETHMSGTGAVEFFDWLDLVQESVGFSG